ncbi:peptidoglycan-binding protein [Bacillota bacterium Meth-B3]
MKRSAALLGAALIALSPLTAFAQDVDFEHLPLSELKQIVAEAEAAIARNHTVSFEVSNKLCELTKLSILDRLPGEPNWGWFDWTYAREWDRLTVTTSVTLSGRQEQPVSAIYRDEGGGAYTLTFLKVGEDVLVDEQADTAAPDSDAPEADEPGDVEGEPIEAAAGRGEDAHSMGMPIDPTATPVPTPDPTPEQAPEAQPDIVADDVEVVAQVGSKGDLVKEVQGYLIALGYLSGGNDGLFGQATQDALKTYQSDRAMTITGQVTEYVRRRLAADAQAGGGIDAQPPSDPGRVLAQLASKGDQVKDIQSRLIALGFLEGGADGRYGEGTERAVKAFEAAQDMPQTGVVTQRVYDEMRRLTRPDKIADLGTFLLLFNAAEQVGGAQAQLAVEAPSGGGSVSAVIDQHADITLELNDEGGILTITVTGRLDGFAEAETSVLNAFISTLTGVGAANSVAEGKLMLREIGAYKDALLESGIGTCLDGDVRYTWQAEDGGAQLSVRLEG